MYILKGKACDQLLEDIERNISQYDTGTFEFSEDDLLDVPYQPRTDKPELIPTTESEGQNAELIHQYLPELTAIQASDRRLWAYLCHVEFPHYITQRFEATAEGGASDRVGKVKERFFAEGGSDRRLEHNALGRIWWGAGLTYMPWERGDEFRTLEKDDPYAYTKVLFSNQELIKVTLESRLCRSDMALMAILYFFAEHPELVNNENCGNLVKELNRVAGVKKLAAFRMKHLIKEVERAALVAIPEMEPQRETANV